MLKTAESVRAGHPDKLCDFIADTILDEALYGDPAARVAVEVLATKARIYVAGEITSKTKVEIPAVVRKALIVRGYDPRAFRIRVRVHRQSLDIAGGVDQSLEARQCQQDAYAAIGAGDQGTVYGYASSETEERLPLPLVFAQRICQRLDEAFADNKLPGLGADGKAQVSIDYENGKAKRVSSVVVSVQNKPGCNNDELHQKIASLIIAPACKELPIDEDTEILINPSGRFIVGGPEADTGLTGRKLMVDTYGGLAPHGGGAFSGKDASKVDRTGAYMARLIARTLVDAKLAEEAQVSISYAIGKADPVAFTVDTFGTGRFDDLQLTAACCEVFPLRPAGMIEALDLGKHTNFRTYSAYGHFGHGYPTWERDWAWVDKLREALGVHY